MPAVCFLVDQNITLDGELACTGDISLTQGTVTGSCAGTDADGTRSRRRWTAQPV